jgi:hypothetical protein
MFLDAFRTLWMAPKAETHVLNAAAFSAGAKLSVADLRGS